MVDGGAGRAPRLKNPSNKWKNFFCCRCKWQAPETELLAKRMGCSTVRGKDAWLLGYIWVGGVGCGCAAHQRYEDSAPKKPPTTTTTPQQPIFIYLKRKKYITNLRNFFPALSWTFFFPCPAHFIKNNKYKGKRAEEIKKEPKSSAQKI